MKKINLDQLHKVKNGRRTGRTFDMVVELLQNVYLSKADDIFLIRIPFMNRYSHILPMIIDLSPNFDLKVEKFNKSKMEILFKPLDNKKLGVVKFCLASKEMYGMDYAEFHDFDH